MTGRIIQFDKYGDLPRSKLYRNQAPPRSLPPRTHDAGGEPGKARSLEQQVVRIADLLNELEELARTAEDFAPATLRQARVAIEGARTIMQPLQASECNADVEGDPQPRLNHEELERMYRALHSKT